MALAMGRQIAGDNGRIALTAQSFLITCDVCRTMSTCDLNRSNFGAVYSILTWDSIIGKQQRIANITTLYYIHIHF